LRAKAGANLGPVIIGRISVEVATLPVLAWLSRHRNLDVHVGTLAWLVPLVDLKGNLKGQVDVQYMHLRICPCLAIEAFSFVHHGTSLVVLDADQAICGLTTPREATDHRRTIICHNSTHIHRCNK